MTSLNISTRAVFALPKQTLPPPNNAIFAASYCSGTAQDCKCNSRQRKALDFIFHVFSQHFYPMMELVTSLNMSTVAVSALPKQTLRPPIPSLRQVIAAEPRGTVGAIPAAEGPRFCISCLQPGVFIFSVLPNL